MGNILGKPFEPWVKEQIDVRQEALGKLSNISLNNLKYYTSKTAWVRLASSINVTSDTGGIYNELINIGIPQDLILGSNLAKNFIIQGGPRSYDSPDLNQGLNKGNIFSGAYGWGGIQERGYVPMPSITRIETQPLNNGALTKTTIDLTCFNKTQFSLIDALYLRPGYTILLEFGWSLYLDRDGNLNSFDNFHSTPLNYLFSEKDQYKIYNAIKEERKVHYGNYEAVFGMVTNFNWQFNRDGSYNCQIHVSGMGDVIESLKMNISIPLKENLAIEKEETQDTESSSPLIANAYKTSLNKILYHLYQTYPSISSIKCNSLKVKKMPFLDPTQGFKTEDVIINNALFSLPGVVSDSGQNQSPQVYITFGGLLAIIQANFLLYNNKTPGNKIPITYFDVDFKDIKKDENFMFTFPGHFSANPKVCLIPYQNSVNLGKIIQASPERSKYEVLGQEVQISQNITLPNYELNEKLNEFSYWGVGGAQYLGRLTSIFVNMNHIASVLNDTPKNEDGSISLLKFLQTIIQDITTSLGGVNQIQIQSTIDGRIEFVENKPQRFNIEDNSVEYSKLNIYGVKDNMGSFVKDINLSGEISNEFFSLIAIGAQANGNQPSADATSFSSYNRGLIDRIVPQKNFSEYESQEKEISNPINTIKEHFKTNINSGPQGLFSQMYGALNFSSENIEALISHNTQYVNLIEGELTKLKQISSPFFLPFNLNLEVEGISGISIYQKFFISEEILPPSYKKSKINLLVRGINHIISQSTWTTRIDTISTLSDVLSSIVKPDPLILNSGPYSILIPESNQILGKAKIPTSLISMPPAISPEDPNRREAMEKSFIGVFKDHGQTNGMCARWVYNLAYNYIKALRGDNKIAGPQLAAEGNARDNVKFFSNLMALGYTRTQVGTNITKQQIISLMRTSVWGYGDIVVYYCNDGDLSSSHVRYGHTQIYVGSLNLSKWATSVKENYSQSFVYGGKPGEKWDFVVFRAPIK